MKTMLSSAAAPRRVATEQPKYGSSDQGSEFLF